MPKTSNEIGIGRVLDEINTLLDGKRRRVFHLRFVRFTGDKIGTIKEVKLASKYSKKGTEKRGGTRGKRLKESKTLLLEDLENHQPFYCKIASIISFNGKKVRH